MTRCRECGNELPQRAAFCDVCGLPTLSACPTCGHQQPADARFCGACGAPLATPAQTASGSDVAPKQPAAPRQGFNPLWIVPIVVIAAALIGGGIWLATRDRGNSVVEAIPADTGEFAAGGDGWVTQWAATDFALHDVSFADPAHGWAVGGGSDGRVGIILATTDGGATWVVQDAGGGFPALHVVQAIDAQTCCAVGFDGTIMTTTDGGERWTARAAAAGSYLRDVTFISPSDGWCVGSTTDGYPLMLRTQDSGATWSDYRFESTHTGDRWSAVQTAPSTSSCPLASVDAVQFADADTGWVCVNLPPLDNMSSSAEIMKTTDGGATWVRVLDILHGALWDVSFVDSRNGWSVGAESKDGGPRITAVWRTSDGGDTWSRTELGDADTVTTVFFVDALHGWLAGDGVYYTRDGGQTWTLQVRPGGPTFAGLFFCDTLTGIVVGSDGAVLATSDGGVGNGSPQAWDASESQPTSLPDDAMRAYLRRLQQLIAQAGRGRQKLLDSIATRDSAGMRDVIRNRTSVLDQVRGIAVPDDHEARRCRAALIASMTASIKADERYLAWTEGRGSKTAAAPHDLRAGAAKKTFVKRYNALAERYGMRSDWQVKDI